MLAPGGYGSFRIFFLLLLFGKAAFYHVVFLCMDHLSDSLKITEIACTLDSRVINQLRFAYDLVMLSLHTKGSNR